MSSKCGSFSRLSHLHTQQLLIMLDFTIRIVNCQQIGVLHQCFSYTLLQGSHVPLSMSVQQRFIAFAGFLHHKGLAPLVADIYKAVEIALKGYVVISLYKFKVFQYYFIASVEY